MKWFSIAVAAAGISVMTWELGRFPLIAVGLASTFALYGAVKKKLNLDAFYSITLETFLFFLLLLLMYFLLGMAALDISMSMTCGQQCFLSAQAL